MKTIFNIDKNFFNYGDSLLYESGETEIASLEAEYNGKVYWVSIQAIGHVCIYFKGEVYKNVSNFPDELIDAIREGKFGEYEDRGELEIRENNWWEICFDNGDGEVLDCTPSEFKDSDEVYETMSMYIDMLIRQDDENYLVTGSKKEVEGGTLYNGDQTFNGYCFKDEYAFKHGYDEICYICEYGFDEMGDDGLLIRQEDMDRLLNYGRVSTRKSIIEEVETAIHYCDMEDEFIKADKKLGGNGEIDFVKNNFVGYIADHVFDIIDWQTPSAYIEELDMYEELDCYVSMLLDKKKAA